MRKRRQQRQRQQQQQRKDNPRTSLLLRALCFDGGNGSDGIFSSCSNAKTPTLPLLQQAVSLRGEDHMSKWLATANGLSQERGWLSWQRRQRQQQPRQRQLTIVRPLVPLGLGGPPTVPPSPRAPFPASLIVAGPPGNCPGTRVRGSSGNGRAPHTPLKIGRAHV